MLSDVTSAPRATRDVSADPADDFEWVNAWAAARSSHTSTAAAPEPMPQGTALVQELAHIPAKERTADAVADQRVAPEPIETPEAPAPVALEPVVASVQPVASETAAPISLDAVSAHDVEMVAPLESPALADTNDHSSAAAAPLMSDAATVALADDVNAPTTAPELVELIDEQPAPADERASAPISFLDFAARAKRWRNLFGIARHREPQLPAEPLDPLEELPSSSDPIAADVPAADAVTLLELAPAIAPDQLELDVAEIEVRRDALLAEWELERRITAVPAVLAPRSRTTDYVPILLGCVLGFTLLVVFGAAASFVSLR
jgi:hypothetical protein